ncbi:MAG: hypothetical protein WAN43_03600 [Rhodomicrobium sp.]|jgi:hypothetical protein
MEDIAETGQLYEAERQIKIDRAEAAVDVEQAEKAEPIENSEFVEEVQLEATPSDLDEPDGTIQAPPEQKIEPARDQMKAGYRYAASGFRGTSA